MNMVIKKTQWICAGLLVALASGIPVLADDTEILLINPTAANPAIPNVMFILDTSGSMGGMVNTRVQYDATRIYPTNAGCSAGRYYYTLVGAAPSCTGGSLQYIEKSSLVCDAATLRMTGIGSYTDTMTHFRDDGTGTDVWLSLQPGAPNHIVECAKDSGVHGAGGNAATHTYANKGSSGVPHTATASQEIDWTGNGVNSAVTMYDGNYLNYQATPEFVFDTKMNIVKDVVSTVLNSISDVNTGLMRFNSADGGPVIQDIVDLNTNRAAMLTAVGNLAPGGLTPLSETLYESALFWRGLPALYGEAINEHATDPGALAIVSPETYQQPDMAACTKNYNVLLTDGSPVWDLDTPGLVDSLPNWSSALGGRVGCTGTNQGDCLDDVAEYLFNDDVNLSVPGNQLVTTHTIGFAIDLPVMQQAATASGGEYFLADDVESLTIALLQIVADVQDRSLSFTAPAVAVNSFNRTRNLNDLYLTTFGARGKEHWPGNLKKYRIADGQIVDSTGTAAVNPTTGFFETSAHSYWSASPDGTDVEEGGASSNLPAPGSRNIYTYNGGSTSLTAPSNAISSANSGAFTLADFGLTGAAQEPTVGEMILWAQGADQADEDNDTDITEARNTMGDPLHSRPAAVIYGGTPSAPDTVIYTATNDGYVHAIDGATGVELWSFVPKEHLTLFSELYFNLDASSKNYGVDGDIVSVTKDYDDDGIIETSDGDFVVIIFGMRRGGGNYYALDVSSKNSPKLLWQFSDPEIGQSWSPPAIARIKMAAGFGQNSENAVVILSGGYDSAHDTISYPTSSDSQGAGVYFLDLESGNVLWRASASATSELTLSDMTRAMPSAVRVIDLNGDSFADRMYASDLGGQLWRFDITNGNAPNGTGSNALVTGGVIAQLGAEGNLPTTDAETRRFYTAPDVSFFNDHDQNKRFIALSIGSGYRAHPLDNTTNERFYSIRDKHVFQPMTQVEYLALTPITETDLVDITGTVGQSITASDAGWLFTLPSNQKVLTESTTFNDEVFFVSFSPDPDNVEGTSCAAGVGRNFLYRVSIANGDPIADLSSVVPGTEDSLRVTTLAQGGIAPSPQFLFPSPDATCTPGVDCKPPPIGCIGVECFDPGFENNPVRTLWTQDGIE